MSTVTTHPDKVSIAINGFACIANYFGEVTIEPQAEHAQVDAAANGSNIRTHNSAYRLHKMTLPIAQNSQMDQLLAVIQAKSSQGVVTPIVISKDCGSFFQILDGTDVTVTNKVSGMFSTEAGTAQAINTWSLTIHMVNPAVDFYIRPKS